MLQFFHDSALTIPDSQSNPKRFALPLAGGSGKTSIVYLADNYIASLTSAAVSGATTLNLGFTDEFLTAGTAQVTSGSTHYTITYTGKTISTLTGVSGITGALNIGDTVKPWKVYKASGNITFTPRGPDLINDIQLSLGSISGSFNFPGSAVITSKTSYDMVQDAPIPVYISIGCRLGTQKEFTSWSINCNPIYTRDHANATAITTTEIGISPTVYGYLSRRDNYQVASLRLLPNTDKLLVNNPGFVIGKYRWRDDTNVNSVVVIPTRWDRDITSIGTGNFVYGIGDRNDLVPIDIENVNSSIYMRIKNGFYFAGPQRFFLPAEPQIQFYNSSQTGVYLDPAPNIGYPVFVGNWSLDNNGFYQINNQYRYRASGVYDSGPNSSVYQYTLNKKTNLLNLNVPFQPKTYFLGLLSGQTKDFFDLPIYPIDSISSVFVNRGTGNENLYSSNFVFNREAGTLTISAPTTGLATSIPNALVGEPVYAVCNPAYAVVYDSGNSIDRLLIEVDLNPAFAGIAEGYLYIQHRRQVPTSLTLSADKPIIDIPATYASVIDLIAYGPVYFGGDYALLTAQAFGPLGNEVIPGATLKIVPGPNFAGTINYKDPTAVEVTGITGADGKCNFLYIPEQNYGYYIPITTASGGLAGLSTTTITNDSLVLPTPIPINQIYNTKEGWLVNTYTIINTDPILGKVGANTALGELPFITTGTSGTSTYKTNGERVLLGVNGIPKFPIDARDSANVSYTNGLFNGLVSKLVFATALPTTGSVAAYFITFVQDVTVQVEYVNSNVISNQIMLQMAMPNQINNNPWLTLNNATQGILNTYRLGWQAGRSGSF